MSAGISITPRPVHEAEGLRAKGHTTFTVGQVFTSAPSGVNQSAAWSAAMKEAGRVA